MLGLFKRNRAKTGDSDESSATESVAESEQTTKVAEKPASGFFTRLRQSLKKTRGQLGDGLSRLLLGKKEINEDILEEIETILLMADIGIETTKSIISELSQKLKRRELSDGATVLANLKHSLSSLLEPYQQPLQFEGSDKPFVILMVGINGAGKTTTIGKLANRFKQQGKRVMLAAGDTFRAAAVEQLKAWGEANEVPVIAQHSGADSASVVFDALQAARARHVDVLIADTAGRLHTQGHLMEELKKIKRVLSKIDESAPHEVMLVLDASIGQNALSQAKEFHQAVGVTGLVMTKLDGSAKGGILFAIANELGIPFRYIGLGEGADDLREFEATSFTNALFDAED